MQIEIVYDYLPITRSMKNNDRHIVLKVSMTYSNQIYSILQQASYYNGRSTQPIFGLDLSYFHELGYFYISFPQARSFEESITALTEIFI